MSLCVLCGLQLAGDSALCAHHDYGAVNGWAVVNRLMCNFLHRGIVPSGPSADAADLELRGCIAEAA